MARQRWGKRIEFFLTAVGFSVGVGDLWRFPYLVMKNGGGAFLIPIVIFNVFGAIPIVYLEMIMGQYSQSGAVSVWRVCPLFKGVGYGTIIATFLFSIYYAVIICWMLYYFIHSLFPKLPWDSCDNDWNIQETCVKIRVVEDSVATTMASNVSSITSTLSPALTSTVSNLTTAAVAKMKPETASEQFFKYEALKISEGLEELGAVNWPIFGCLAAIEVVCFLCIFKGVKLTGKVVYFTVLGPFAILLVFLIRGALLEGADIGIKFYLTPDLDKLSDISIWAEACMQVFVSIGPGFGGMITFASYNKFSNNCMRDAILVCLMDLLTGFLGGFVIFSVLGHVSHKTGIEIENFKESGFSLGFIAYPEAANYLPPPQLWCALFFVMSIFLGIDSQFPNYEIVVTALRDEFSKLLKGKTTILTLIVILAAFLLAIPMVTEGGMYLLTLVDWYAATFSVTIFALTELLVMTYIYGIKNIDQNMLEMTGRRVPIVFKICWLVITPILLTVTLGFTVYTYSPPAYQGYVYKPWAVALGWCIAAASIVPIPVYIMYSLYNGEGTILERLRAETRPNELWGPPAEVRELEGKKHAHFALANQTLVVQDAEKSKEGDAAVVNGGEVAYLKKNNAFDNPMFNTRL
ncbi:sodium- and chloride-dependent glycine transporter 1-like [Mya arenaria]|uniref:sodium- and chloride-dependent glycine transporter 1-like n=1 Tax=Mya arenaria TaxID=6604 RepID=UPI0022E72801|nr:sodium- and chloride-dependent glycine transporter 1-like [Mya arenaria]